MFKLDSKLDDVLNNFDNNRHHIGLVYNEFGTYVGIITLEDVLETIINREIVDEIDKHVDLRETIK